MKIVVDIGHPAHVHLFKNFVWEMQKRGHELLITTSKKDVSIQLLDAYGFDYIHLGSYGFSIAKKIINIPIMDLRMYRAVKDFKPDIFVGMAAVRTAHVSKLTGKTSITFQDTEPGIYHAKILCNLFTDAILTPSCFKKELGTKQIRYNGYHELAYLHPNYFKPNPAVLDELGLSRDDTFIILRFVAWRSPLEVGKRSTINKIALVRELEKYGRVFITSEGELENDLEKYKIKVPPEKLHDLLYYAKMLIGESQTMTTEAGVLGTPAVRCNSWVGENDMSNFIELEQKYALIFNFNDLNKALEKAVELIQNPNLKEEWRNKREVLLKDKIDVTPFMVWFIENYPDSFKEMKENPEMQYRFM
jgi:predicted glycosyltransferase